MSETTRDPREAVRQLARCLYQELQKTADLTPDWDDLPKGRKIDYCDAILVLSDMDIYWRVLFDNPDDPICGSVVIGDDPSP